MPQQNSHELNTDKNKNRATRWLSVLVIAAFIISLMPVLYLSFTDVATGDDYGYGAATRAAWLGTHSLQAVFTAAADGVRGTYASWQGTWFSVFMFALNPEVFNAHAYWIVPWLVLALQICSVLTFTHHFLVIRCGMDGLTWVSVSCLLLMAEIQCAMSPQSAIFWYVGTTHYMLPFAMALFAVVLGDRFLTMQDGTRGVMIRDYVLLLILQTLLGGASYQAALLVPLTLTVILLMKRAVAGRQKTDVSHAAFRRECALLIPFIAELAGLIISAKAPGNKARGGENFGFSFAKAAETILQCFAEAAQQAVNYLLHYTYAVIAVILIGILVHAAVSAGRRKGTYRHPLFFILLMLCLNASAHAPALYAAVDVSGGVGNTNFYVFLFTLCAVVVYLTGWAEEKRLEIPKPAIAKAALVLVILLMCILGRHSLKATTDYVCYTYISSGQAADYRMQTAQQYELLTQEDVTDPVVPMINDVQGPLQQMPVTTDPAAWSNTVTARFYGKKSVTGMDRAQWNEMYQK